MGFETRAGYTPKSESARGVFKRRWGRKREGLSPLEDENTKPEENADVLEGPGKAEQATPESEEMKKAA